MSNIVSLWLRRSSARMFFVVLLAVSALVVSSRSAWWWQWDWAMSWASATTIVVAPLLAGITAFDVQRARSTTMQALTASTRRGSAGFVGLAAAHWVVAVTVWAAGIGYAAIRVLTAGGGGAPAPWVFFQSVVALGAAAALGLAVGTLIPNLTAGPVAAVVAYLLPLALFNYGADGVLSAGGAVGASFGSTPRITVAVTEIAVNTALAIAFTLVAFMRTRPRLRGGLVVGGAISGLVAVAALAVLGMQNPRVNALRPTGDAPVCVGEQMRVCGPPDSRPILLIAQRNLSDARDKLAVLGLATADRYQFQPPAPTDPGTGNLLAGLEGISNGRLDKWDVAVTLATPTTCPAYFGDSPPVELLGGQARLARWIVDHIDGTTADAVELNAATATYKALRACSPDALPKWRYDE